MGKIDNEVLVKALVEGKTYTEAGKLAGSTAKQIKNTVCKKIQHSPTIKRDIVEQLEEKRQMILTAMTEDRITGQSLAQLSTSLGIITDKIELLSGHETQRIGIKPIIFRDTEEKPEQ